MSEADQETASVKVGTRFRCTTCGSEVVVVRAPASTPHCCGSPMARIGQG
jgi:hypothetical protein